MRRSRGGKFDSHYILRVLLKGRNFREEISLESLKSNPRTSILVKIWILLFTLLSIKNLDEN